LKKGVLSFIIEYGIIGDNGFSSSETGGETVDGA
jgi:hypothetical protein